jgi:hypothetical protein
VHEARVRRDRHLQLQRARGHRVAV